MLREKLYISQLTSIRFFAAYLVICHHFMRFNGPGARIPFLDLVGDFAVSLFFVLSGFVLSLSNHDDGGNLKKSRKNYIVGRIARIYPLYIISFILAAPFFTYIMYEKYSDFPRFAIHLAGNAAVYLSLMQSWTPWSANAWNGPGWSLSVEAFFYAMFVFFRPPTGKMLWAWALLSIATLSLAAVAGHFMIGNLVAVNFWKFFPPLRLGEFTLGLVIAQMYRHSIGTTWIRANANALVGACTMTLALVLCLTEPVAVRFASSILLPVLLLSVAHSTGRLAQVLSLRPLVFLGEASFALYLIQLPAFRTSEIVLSYFPSIRLSTPAGFLIASGFTVVLSCIIHKYLEMPGFRQTRRYLTAITDRPARAVSSA